MHPAARDAFKGITIPLEAEFPHMYRDVLGYVTVGIGNKIDPLTDAAIAWLWIKGNGRRASADQVRTEWNHIKGGPLNSGNTGEAAKIATLHLEEPERDRIFYATVDAFEKVLKSQFADWNDWPANAQLVVMSMAWNFGPGFKIPPAPPGGGWPTLATFLDKQDWWYAHDHCTPKVGTSDRSRQNRVMFLSALLSEVLMYEPASLWDVQGPLIQARILAWMSDPNKFSITGWWVQTMLIEEGTYPVSGLDGLFGPMSRKALGNMTTMRLQSLSDKTLRVRVTA